MNLCPVSIHTVDTCVLRPLQQQECIFLNKPTILSCAPIKCLFIIIFIEFAWFASVHFDFANNRKYEMAYLHTSLYEFSLLIHSWTVNSSMQRRRKKKPCRCLKYFFAILFCRCCCNGSRSFACVQCLLMRFFFMTEWNAWQQRDLLKESVHGALISRGPFATAQQTAIYLSLHGR